VDLGRAASPADFDQLVGLMPQLSSLSNKEQDTLLSGARILEAPANTAIIRYDEDDDNAYFILSGRVLVGLYAASGDFRSLNILEPGDFFGEIAALTGSHRTADVVTQEAASLMQVTSEAMRGVMGNPVISQLVLSKMTERLSAAKITDLPRFAGYDQKELRELRTVEG
jgi:CRP-like cAMP-binding protein